MIIVIVSFVLDNLISNLLNYNSIFNPLFTIISLILIYSDFSKRNNNYFIYAFILGLIYDITVTDTLFLNAFIFLSLAYILKKIFNKITYNYFSILFISIGTVIYYRVVTYFVLLVINYLNLNIFTLFESIYSSLVLNIIYISIFYLTTHSKRLIFKTT